MPDDRPATGAARTAAARAPVGPWAGRDAPRLAIAAIAACAFAAEMAVSARYGYHRDELYFLQAGQHPALGYVDQPALTPLAARAMAALTGNSLAGLRVLPALVLAALVILAAAMSRMLGAGRAGQVVAALATATCAEHLATGHLLTTTTLDFGFWALMLYVATRLMASADPGGGWPPAPAWGWARTRSGPSRCWRPR